MLILIAIIIAAAVGTALHFGLPFRSTRGTIVGPLLAVSVAAVVWTSLTWVGFAEDNLWLWLAAIAVPAVVTAIALPALGRARTAHDAEERARLRIP